MNPVLFQIIGLIISYLFVFALIGIAYFLEKRGVSQKNTRKIIHIGVGNWIILAIFLFTDWYFAIIGPISFIVLNYISYKKDIFGEGMELREKRTPGTVYYAIALSIVVFFFWKFTTMPERLIALLGILSMAWGDGMASVVGEASNWGEMRIMGNRKTVPGSLAMWFFSSVVIFLVLLWMGVTTSTAITTSLLWGLLGTILELITPAGLDNLSVPLIISFGYYLTILYIL